MDNQSLYKQMIENLRLLSALYDVQKESLPDYADVMDDVTSLFKDSFLILPQLIENGFFSNNSLAWIIRTYNKMEWCIVNIGIDDVGNAEWDKLRDFAKETLKQIG